MSLDFDGVDDVVTSDATQTYGNTVTVAAWFNADSQGEGNAGRVLEHGLSASRRLFLAWNGGASSEKLHVLAGWSGTEGIWVMTTGFAAVTGWKFVAVTYDFGATTNDPILYTLDGSTFSILTVGSGLTESAAPTGAPRADNIATHIGNNSATSGTFEGRIAEVVVWKRILTFEEIQSVALLGVNAIPDHFNYLPLDPTAQNLGSSATAFTITGAVAGENPPVRGTGRKG